MALAAAALTVACPVAATALIPGPANALRRSRAAPLLPEPLGVPSDFALAERASEPPPWIDAALRLAQRDVQNFANSLGAAVSACEGTVFDASELISRRVDAWSKSRAPIAQWAGARCLEFAGFRPTHDAPELADALKPIAADLRPRRVLSRKPRRFLSLAVRFVTLRVVAVANALARGRNRDVARGPPRFKRRRDRVVAGLLRDIELALDAPAAEPEPEDLTLACRRLAETTLQESLRPGRAAYASLVESCDVSQYW